MSFYGHTPSRPSNRSSASNAERSRVSTPLVNRYLHPSQDSFQYTRGDYLPPVPQSPYGLQEEATESSLLQTISLTVSDLQQQLSDAKKRDLERDEVLKKVQEELEDLKTERTETGGKNTSKGSRKSPRGLSACVRKIHSSLDDEEKYRADERINTPHNVRVTNKIVKEVKDAGEYTCTCAKTVEYAAKKYHEYLVRQEKPVSEFQKQTNARNGRMIQRRQRLYERRCKHATVNELKVMKLLNEKYMSDEETDTENLDAFVKRTPNWRSEKLNKLISKLDARYNRSRKNNARPSKRRSVGVLSERRQPPSAPNWATQRNCSINSDSVEATNTCSTSSESSESVCDTAHDSVEDANNTTSESSVCDTAHDSVEDANNTSSVFGTADDSNYQDSMASDEEMDSFIRNVTGV